MSAISQASNGKAAQDLNKIIERAKQELEQMIDLAPQVMLLVDGRGSVLRANKALLEFGGFSGFEQVLGQPLGRVFAYEEPSFIEGLLRNRNGADACAVAVKRGDGVKREVAFTLIGPEGKSDLHVIMASDVTDERAQRASLEKKHKIEAASAMVCGLMHNINQLLTVITITAKLMHMEIEKGTFQADEMKQRLETIMDLTMQVAGILKQAENPKDFVAEKYPGPGNHEIINIQQI